MTKYILHGGCTRKDNELNRTFWKELVADVPDGGTVLLVYFADRGTIEQKSEEHKASIANAALPKRVEFLVATEEGFLDEVAKADAIFLNGGNTEKLIGALKNYPNFAEAFAGKTVVGSSAGAYALSSFGSVHGSEGLEGGLHKGFGIVPLRVICHYESLELPPLPASVSQLKETAPELELVYLKDCEWKVFTQ